MKKFSVIIPAYNCEKYITECLESIKKQSFTDYEIIIIDDCSRDDTLKNIASFASQNQNIDIRVIRNDKNSGVSAMRNKGIKEARGEFILFADADDYYSDDKAFEKFNSTLASDTDILVFGCRILHLGEENKRVLPEITIKPRKKDTDPKNELSVFTIAKTVWQTCYRREFLLQNDISFQEDISVYEDVIFRQQAVAMSKKIAITDTVAYTYNRRVKNASSITINERNDYLAELKKLTKATKRIEEIAQNGDFPPEIRKRLLTTKLLLPVGFTYLSMMAIHYKWNALVKIFESKQKGEAKKDGIGQGTVPEKEYQLEDEIAPKIKTSKEREFMGQVNGIAKWNLKTDGWETISTKSDKKKALSTVSYRDIIHDESDKSFHYILIADGYRVENLSSNGQTVSERKDGIKNVISFFEKKKANYRIELLLVDNDAPLKEDGKYFASYIDRLSESDDVKSINYIGFSKCGVIGFDMIKYIKSLKALAKTNVFCVSAPYTGTLMASPKIVEREAKQIIEAKLGKNVFSKQVLNALLGFYNRMLSDSHMDFDIALPNGIKDDQLDRYDPSFLQEIFSPSNIAAAARPNHFQNICTVINDETAKSILRNCDLVGIGLLLINEMLFKEPADGLVSLRAQQSIESHMELKDSKLIIPSPHAVLERPFCSDLLSVVDTVIQEKPYVMRPIDRQK